MANEELSPLLAPSYSKNIFSVYCNVSTLCLMRLAPRLEKENTSLSFVTWIWTLYPSIFSSTLQPSWETVSTVLNFKSAPGMGIPGLIGSDPLELK